MASNPNSPNVWSKNNTQTTKNKLQFTMKREYDKAREEAELVKQLRNVSVCISSLIICLQIENIFFVFQTIESRLKMSLPSELSPALNDGVVLCYLANHVKPRSVASIHVPSPAVVNINKIKH